MSDSKYDEETVVRQLQQKHDIRIDTQQGMISCLLMPWAKGDIGIKSKGKIDFLINHRDYKIQFTPKF